MDESKKMVKDCECRCHKFVEVMSGVYYPAGMHHTEGGKCYCEVNKSDAAKHQGH